MMEVNKRVTGLIINESKFNDNIKTDWFVPLLLKFQFKKSNNLLIIPTNISFEQSNTQLSIVEHLLNSLRREYNYLMIKINN